MNLLGRPALPKERGHSLPVCDRIVDDATTLLAALRMNLTPPEMPIPVFVISEFLSAARIISGRETSDRAGTGIPGTGRQDALAILAKAWMESETFNELLQVPDIVFEGRWNNQPRATREFLLHLLDLIPENTWWSLPAFILGVKEKYPDFQRPAGDYDSWFIKRETDGTYLRGFPNWDEVDGALIRYIITGPLYWLGRVELATTSKSEIVTAFRVGSNVKRQKTETQRQSINELGKIHVSSQGNVVIPRLMSRTVRYQIARFCEWGVDKEDEYKYRVTTRSLKKAGEQGLKVNQLLSLLAKNSATEIPPVFIKALKRWELHGTEARIVVQTILKVDRPEVLDDLRKSKAARFIGETLGPVTVVVKPGAQIQNIGCISRVRSAGRGFR